MVERTLDNRSVGLMLLVYNRILRRIIIPHSGEIVKPFFKNSSVIEQDTVTTPPPRLKAGSAECRLIRAAQSGETNGAPMFQGGQLTPDPSRGDW